MTDPERLDARARYTYDHGVLPPLALSRERPDDEPAFAPPRPARLHTLAVTLHGLFDPFDELQDFEDLLVDPAPAIVGAWRDDLAFAEQRLAGAAPRLLARIDHLPEHLDLQDPELRASLTQAGFEGRLFLADYALLRDLPGGGQQQHSRFVHAPLALFTWEPDPDATRDAPPSQRGALRPAAIQLGQEPGRDDLFTPRDGPRWLLARTLVQSADHLLAVVSEQIGRIFLGMEPFALTSARQLSPSHPVRRLLRPHLRDLIARSHYARDVLLVEGGPIERLYGPTLAGSLELIRRSAAAADHAETLPRALERLGRHPDLLPHDPWRDDGLLLWSALHEFVGAFLRWAYPSDAKLAADAQLRAWLDELRSPAGGRLVGTPTEPERAPIVDLLTHVIFTLGPVHHALSRGLSDYGTYVPNYPAAIYSPPPAGPVGERELLAALPPRAQALEQVQRLAPRPAPELPLGYFGDDLQDPPALHDLCVTLQERLMSAEQRIARRNAERQFPHHGLLSSAIPNGLGP